MASSTGVRTVFRELRCSLNQPKIKDLKITQYILNQYRKHQITEKQHCKVCLGFLHALTVGELKDLTKPQSLA